MPHRGRINILHQFLKFKSEALFTKILGSSEIDPNMANYGLTGDVLSHLYKRSNMEYSCISKKGSLDITLLPNPSHLEAINPVACGFVKAHQIHHSIREKYSDVDVYKGIHNYLARTNSLLLQIHGDAAFAGQGVIYETFNLANLEHYDIGGSVHLVVNNQLGFTAEHFQTRSSPYPTDIAKINGYPIIHVNGDYPELAAIAAQVALAYRQKYQKDVLVNLVCYRKYGHNEIDDPTFTNPHIYRMIQAKKSVPDMYTQNLVNILSNNHSETYKEYSTLEYWDKYKEDSQKKLNDALTAARDYVNSSTKENFDQGKFYDYNLLSLPSNGGLTDRQMTPSISKTDVSQYFPFHNSVWYTGLPISALAYIANKSVDIRAHNDTYYKHFKLHPHLEKVHVLPRINLFSKSVDEIVVDWGTSETIALGSLLLQGIHIRFSGQDSGRGTFSHRHFEFTDYNTLNYPIINEEVSTNDPLKLYQCPAKIIPLNHMVPRQKAFLQIINSPLHELGALSFELGYSWYNPHNLAHKESSRTLPNPPSTTMVIWEAQFGDFFNGAQTLIDTFISSCYEKWGLSTGLVLLLPHGMDGTGPEHSSCRVERFLQLSNDPQSMKNLGYKQIIQDKKEREPEKYINFTVVNPTTTAQYFHLLRAHACSLNDGKLTAPLIVVAPKLLIRFEAAKSRIAEFTGDTHFLPVLDDPRPFQRITRLVFCSGKHYYSLLNHAPNLKKMNSNTESNYLAPDTVKIVRIELLSPFPAYHIQTILSKHSRDHIADLVWAQEEHKNQGPWNHIQTRFLNYFGIRLKYAGRSESSVPATGISSLFKSQETDILKAAFYKDLPF
ncbi:unnamed protein product [Gordionus sp. m RMFG-2023]